MKALIPTIVAVLITAASTLAQTPPPGQRPAPPPNENPTPQPVACGKPDVRSASQLVRDGAPVKFTVNLNGGDAKNVIYSWSISSGIITNGQGTPTIDVDTTGAGVDKEISATVMLGGLPPECFYQASGTVKVAAPAKKVDEYATLKEDEESARLGTYMSNVTQSEQGFIFIYAGRNSVRGQTDTEIRRLRGTMQKAGIGNDRLVIVNGGFREEPAHELWLVPLGAEPPRATPTINPKDIVYPKPTPPVVKKPGQ